MKYTALIPLCAALLLCVVSSQARQQSQPSQPRETSSAPPKSEPAKKPPRKRVVTDLSGFDLLTSKRQQGDAPMVSGATRGVHALVALAPKLARLYGSNPVFHWAYPGKSAKFIFLLQDVNRKEVLRIEVAGLSCAYPESAPALDPGQTYFWSVEPVADFPNGEPSDRVGFVVVSGEERSAVDVELGKIKEMDPMAAGLARACI